MGCLAHTRCLSCASPLRSSPPLASRARYQPDCCLEFPRGGSQAMVDALVRGLEKHGGRLLLRSHVEEITTEGGKAPGGAWAGVVRAVWRAAQCLVGVAACVCVCLCTLGGKDAAVAAAA